MPVIRALRRLLRGRIRAQTQYSIIIVRRLILAYTKNANLNLFQPGTGIGSVSNMDVIILQWQQALDAAE